LQGEKRIKVVRPALKKKGGRKRKIHEAIMFKKEKQFS